MIACGRRAPSGTSRRRGAYDRLVTVPRLMGRKLVIIVAFSYARLGRHGEAITAGREAVDLARRLNDPEVRAEAVNALGEAYRFAGENRAVAMDVGRSKVLAAAERIRALRPDIELDARESIVDTEAGEREPRGRPPCGGRLIASPPRAALAQAVLAAAEARQGDHGRDHAMVSRTDPAVPPDPTPRSTVTSSSPYPAGREDTAPSRASSARDAVFSASTTVLSRVTAAGRASINASASAVPTPRPCQSSVTVTAMSAAAGSSASCTSRPTPTGGTTTSTSAMWCTPSTPPTSSRIIASSSSGRLVRNRCRRESGERWRNPSRRPSASLGSSGQMNAGVPSRSTVSPGRRSPAAGTPVPAPPGTGSRVLIASSPHRPTSAAIARPGPAPQYRRSGGTSGCAAGTNAGWHLLRPA